MRTKKKRGRGRRRRNIRTQQPVRMTITRTGPGRTTVLETSEWLRAPSGWEIAALGMRVQANEARRKLEKRQKQQRRATRERRKESKAERWRRKYQKTSDSPFMRLPGMAGASITPSKARVLPEEIRRQAGMAGRGSLTTLTPDLARAVLELRATGMSYRRIAVEVEHPESTIRHWLGTGRAEAVAKDGG